MAFSDRVCTMPACGEPLPDMAVICYGCTAKLISALRSIPELMDDLAVTFMKRSRTAQPGGPTGIPDIDPVRMPYNLAASHAKADLLGILISWAALVSEQRRVRVEAYDNHGVHVTDGPTPFNCPMTATAISGWLLQYTGWIRHHEAAADCVMEVREAVATCRRIIDAPRTQRFIGLCECGGNLWVPEGEDVVECPACGAAFTVWSKQRANLDSIKDMIAYREQLAMAMTANGCALSAGLIHKWESRGRLEVARRDARGRKMYRLGDVQDLWNKHNDRKR